jgi:hypothetical protein
MASNILGKCQFLDVIQANNKSQKNSIYFVTQKKIIKKYKLKTDDFPRFISSLRIVPVFCF